MRNKIKNIDLRDPNEVAFNSFKIYPIRNSSQRITILDADSIHWLRIEAAIMVKNNYERANKSNPIQASFL